MSKKTRTSGKQARRSFTEQFKKDAVNLVAVEGYSFNRAAQAVGVSSNSLRGWYEKYAPEPEACGDDATFGQLQSDGLTFRRNAAGGTFWCLACGPTVWSSLTRRVRIPRWPDGTAGDRDGSGRFPTCRTGTGKRRPSSEHCELQA